MEPLKLTTYITFAGNCEEALNFYADVFGGRIDSLSRFEGSPAEGAEAGNKVLHAVFSAGAFQLMGSDGEKEQPPRGPIHLSLNCSSEEEINRLFARMSEGAQITMPLDNTFWGARFGMLTDRFGVNWMFNYDFPQDSPATGG